MTTEEQIQYWIRLSDYDLETANAMLQTKRYLYVGFMCHQTIEKIFKAYYTKLKEETPPYIHKLESLAQRSGFYEILNEEQKTFVDKLDPLNIKTRYPDYKSRLARQLTPDVCIQILEQTKNLQKWTKEQLL
ncbi:DNA-binding protein [Bacteroidia bacterium]|nr:DNA-binding protein [Bacteroidia bacterium]